MCVVIVGGTGEARRLAEELQASGCPVVTSLAGRTANRAALPGQVRVGGFGGVTPMADWLGSVGAWCLVDATHPFAAAMQQRCAEVAQVTGLPLLRLARPSWSSHPQAATWLWVADHDEAVSAINRPTALVTVGKQEAARYFETPAVLRMTEPPAEQVPAGVRLLLERGPFSLEQERATFARYDINTLVSKDSGGTATQAKLAVAAEREAQVIMIRRPTLPAGIACLTDPAAALAWALTHCPAIPG